MRGSSAHAAKGRVSHVSIQAGSGIDHASVRRREFSQVRAAPRQDLCRPKDIETNQCRKAE